MDSNDEIYSDLRKNIREFVQKEVEPIAKKMDIEDYFPIETFKKMGEMGYLGITIPEEYGGVGLGYLGQAIIEEEIGYSSPSLALSYGAHSNLTLDNLYRNGNKFQRDEYIPKLCSGQWIGSLGLTEPMSGSDALSMRTTSKKEGEHFIINGSKTYITNAPYADLFLTYAKYESHHSAFVVLSDDKGFSRGKKFDKMGMRGSPTGEIYFDNLKIPENRLVGKLGEGKNIILSGLNSERAILSFIFIGLARRSLEEAIRYSIERKQFGESLYTFEMIQDKLATMFSRYRAAKLLAYDSIERVQKDNMDVKDAAASILYSAQVSEYISRETIQIFGGAGYMHDTGVDRLMRDAILGQIGAGTTEIRKKLVASSLVKDYMEGRNLD
jgi:isovaleryl-CoA dehydrogenase